VDALAREAQALPPSLHTDEFFLVWDMVERWIGDITTKRIQRGAFGRVPELVEAIEGYIALNNGDRTSFMCNHDGQADHHQGRPWTGGLRDLKRSRAI
jgi:hypothetical protein